MSAPITYAVITSHTLLPCDFSLVNWMAALSIGVATMSSLASYELEIPRSKGNVDARLNESESTRSKQVTHDVAENECQKST